MERTSKRSMTVLPANHIIEHAPRVAHYADTLLIYGKRRFMRNTIDLGQSILELHQRVLV